MPSVAPIRWSDRPRRSEGAHPRARRGLPAVLVAGILAAVAVTVTACAVVLGSGRGGQAEVGAAQLGLTVPTPLLAENASRHQVSVGVARLAYFPGARQAGGPGQPPPPTALASPLGALQRSWSTIKLMFR